MSDEIVVLSDADVESLIDFRGIVDALEAVYRELGSGTASVRPRSWTLLKRQQPGFSYGANTLEGGGKELGYYALRISSVVRRDPDAELGARHQTGTRDASGRRFDGLVLLFSLEDGSPVALIPSFSISRQRVAGSSGVAAWALARRDSRSLGVIGSGSHAVSHTLTFASLFALEAIKVWSPNAEHRARFAAHIGKMVDAQTREARDAEEAMEADLVVLATSSYEPVYRPEWVQPGTHLTSINMYENPPGIDEHADIVVMKGKGKATFHPAAEIGVPREMALHEPLDWQRFPDLGEVLVGRASGRTGPRQITFFRNNEGLGTEFAALGARAFHLALERGLGRRIPLDWFLTAGVSEVYGTSYFMQGAPVTTS